MLFQIGRRDQQHLGQRLADDRQRQGDDHRAHDRQHGRVDIGRNPLVPGPLHAVSDAKGHQQRGRDAGRHDPALQVHVQECRADPAIGARLGQRNRYTGGQGQHGIDQRQAELQLAASLEQTAHRVDEGVDGHPAKQYPVQRQHHGLQMPEAHREAFAKLARQPAGRRVRRDQPHHHQRQRAHAGVHQRINAVEHDGERTGSHPETDADDGDAKRDRNRDPQHALLRAQVEQCRA